MRYKLKTAYDGILKIETINDKEIVWWVPNDPMNGDWAKYQAWLAEDPENNIPEPSED